MKGLIISSGRLERYDLLSLVVKSTDFVVCADGGLDHIMKIGYRPNLVLGDLDSISEAGIRYIEKNHIALEKFPVEKDATDTELAMEYLIQKGCNNISLIGVTGTRMDHTIANIFLLDQMFKRGVKGQIIDDNNEITLVNDYIEISKNDGYLSLIPIEQIGAIVTIKGVYYPLNKHHIEFGSTFSVSNKIVEDKAKLTIYSGKVLVIKSRD